MAQEETTFAVKAQRPKFVKPRSHVNVEKEN